MKNNKQEILKFFSKNIYSDESDNESEYDRSEEINNPNEVIVIKKKQEDKNVMKIFL